MKKLFLNFILVLIFVFAGLNVGITKGDSYTCFADKYPLITKHYNFMALGQERTTPDGTFRVIAEGKDPKDPVWIQVFDKKPYDHKCDFVILLIKQGLNVRIAIFDCSLLEKELSKGLKVKNILHYAGIKKDGV